MRGRAPHRTMDNALRKKESRKGKEIGREGGVGIRVTATTTCNEKGGGGRKLFSQRKGFDVARIDKGRGNSHVKHCRFSISSREDR